MSQFGLKEPLNEEHLKKKLRDQIYEAIDKLDELDDRAREHNIKEPGHVDVN